MRIGKRGFEARVKGDLSIEFGAEKLTSHAAEAERTEIVTQQRLTDQQTCP